MTSTSTIAPLPRVHAPATDVAAAGRPPRPRPSPLRGGDIATFVAVNLAVVVAMWWRHGGTAQLDSRVGWLIGLGQLTALVGTLAVLAQLVLVARVPWLERRYGMDRLNAWHRWNGFAATGLLGAHALLTTLGYAADAGSGVAEQLGDFVLHWPDLLAALVGLGLILAVTATSIRAARRALSYETWWFVHLYAYLGVALAFAHQLAVGADFVDDPWARAYWVGLYVATGALVVGHRWLTPVLRHLRHRLRVVDVVREGPGVVSVVLGGRHLDRLPAASGQFLLLRFLTRERWWKAHPMSLSASPDGRTMRFTIKALGDDTTALQHVGLGTRVMAEGPYGAFTATAARQRKVALIAAGIGITPIRAIYEDIERGPGEVDLLYRARNRDEAVLLDELVDLSRRRGFGLRVSYSRPPGPRPAGHPFTPAALLEAVPDLVERDVFLCGPTSFLDAAVNGLRRAGVPRRQIHAERFAY